MIADSNIPTFKIVLVGERKVGKSTFVKRNKTGEFETNYNASIDLETTELSFYTNRGSICFHIHNIPPYKYFLEGYLLGADAAIIMFDLSNQNSYLSVPLHHKSIKKVCNEIPIVLCGNKSDEKSLKDNEIIYHQKHDLKYCEISTKNTDDNFETPFLEIAKLLVNDADLSFVAFPTMPYFVFDKEILEKFELELIQANNITLPDDDDDF
jgi:GTP-binding nuclear protein Ran